MSLIDPSKIKINCINIFRTKIIAEESYLTNPKDVKQTKVGLSQESRFDFGNKLVAVRLNVVLEAINKDQELMGVKGEFGIEFNLTIENLELFLEQNTTDHTIKVSGELGATIMGIIYSTARGIILEKTQNSYLRGVILPVINPANLLKN
ncbi:MAG: hypothetical protein PHP30_06060 [Bacteroidales bacterium]|nr:hypothetical protein [Bacteroidales bacterium]MDD2425305.1 hypothetical protein [Bacteroidales bacterium]MDD3989641.1 hypothetical protein [Bacteroidales bacterium]